MSKIPLPVIDQDVLVFDVEDARRLRDLGIMGTLMGSLSLAPQQNNFLGLPLKLSIYEVVWLVDNALGELKPSNPSTSRFNNRNGLYYRTPYTNAEETEEIGQIRQNEGGQIEEMGENLSLMRSRIDDGLYSIFSELKRKRYFMLPGLKFGGHFIAYPGDPLRYHSHLIVNAVEGINFYNLVVSGRLASGVKKLYVVSKMVGIEESGVLFDEEEETRGEIEGGAELEETGETQNQKQIHTQGVQDPLVNTGTTLNFKTHESFIYKKHKNMSFSIEWAGFG